MGWVVIVAITMIRSFILGMVMVSVALRVGWADSFHAELEFVKKHTTPVVLTDDSGKSRVLVAPELQGRVLTSAVSEESAGYGWINHDLLASGQKKPHMNPYGGEDRFWIGPEGGQFSVFFPAGAPFVFEHWQTPAPLDTEAYPIKDKNAHQVTFEKDFSLTNYAGTVFSMHVVRTVRVLPNDELWSDLKVKPDGSVQAVAYESVNRLTNAGKKPWEKATGLPSIWILGMYQASPTATVLIPYHQGDETSLGKIVETAYFGDIPAERLKVGNGIIQFKGDGHYRSKIGLAYARAFPVAGSYDPTGKVLTIVQYNKPEKEMDYVNSQWKQTHPFGGDVVNSYNDDQGLGNFFELETSSPAAALAPGGTIQHIHRTIHLTGDEAHLDAIAKAVLGTSLKAIQQ